MNTASATLLPPDPFATFSQAEINMLNTISKYAPGFFSGNKDNEIRLGNLKDTIADFRKKGIEPTIANIISNAIMHNKRMCGNNHDMIRRQLIPFVLLLFIVKRICDDVQNERVRLVGGIKRYSQTLDLEILSRDAKYETGTWGDIIKHIEANIEKIDTKPVRDELVRILVGHLKIYKIDFQAMIQAGKDTRQQITVPQPEKLMQEVKFPVIKKVVDEFLSNKKINLGQQIMEILTNMNNMEDPVLKIEFIKNNALFIDAVLNLLGATHDSGDKVALIAQLCKDKKKTTSLINKKISNINDPTTVTQIYAGLAFLLQYEMDASKKVILGAKVYEKEIYNPEETKAQIKSVYPKERERHFRDHLVNNYAHYLREFVTCHINRALLMGAILPDGENTVDFINEIIESLLKDDSLRQLYTKFHDDYLQQPDGTPWLPFALDNAEINDFQDRVVETIKEKFDQKWEDKRREHEELERKREQTEAMLKKIRKRREEYPFKSEYNFPVATPTKKVEGNSNVLLEAQPPPSPQPQEDSDARMEDLLTQKLKDIESKIEKSKKYSYANKKPQSDNDPAHTAYLERYRVRNVKMPGEDRRTPLILPNTITPEQKKEIQLSLNTQTPDLLYSDNIVRKLSDDRGYLVQLSDGSHVLIRSEVMDGKEVLMCMDPQYTANISREELKSTKTIGTILSNTDKRTEEIKKDHDLLYHLQNKQMLAPNIFLAPNVNDEYDLQEINVLGRKDSIVICIPKSIDPETRNIMVDYLTRPTPTHGKINRIPNGYVLEIGNQMLHIVSEQETPTGTKVLFVPDLSLSRKESHSSQRPYREAIADLTNEANFQWNKLQENVTLMDKIRADYGMAVAGAAGPSTGTATTKGHTMGY